MKRKILPIAITVASFSVAGISNAQINVNGFATIAAGQSLTEDQSLYGYNEHIRFENGSHLGLQFSSDLGDGVSATAQLITKGQNDWEVEAEWAYISYDINDSIKLIAGKQRSPYYAYSDYVDVGYAYHWITPPEPVYSLPFDSTNAISLVMNNYFGDLDSTTQIMFGRVSTDDIDSYNSLTLNWTGVYDFATFRVGHTMSTIDITISDLDPVITGLEGYASGAGLETDSLIEQIEVSEDPVSFTGVGLTLDFDDYFAIAEYTLLNLNNSFLGLGQSYYLSSGYRVNDFTIHATIGGSTTAVNENIEDEIETLNDSYALSDLDATYQGLIAGIQGLADSVEADSMDISAGVRWDFHSSTAFKFDITNSTDNLEDEDNSRLIYRAALTTVF